jgi:hypothetical protein
VFCVDINVQYQGCFLNSPTAGKAIGYGKVFQSKFQKIKGMNVRINGSTIRLIREIEFLMMTYGLALAAGYRFTAVKRIKTGSFSLVLSFGEAKERTEAKNKLSG